MPPETPDEAGADPVLDPATAAAVRRLLAEARHDEPTPPAVVARLDATLADLRAERAAPPAPPAAGSPAPSGLPPRPSGGVPVDLAAHRRRRRGTLLLAAAAAVVAVGVGGVVVPQLGGQGDSSVSSDADSSPESQGDAGAGQAPQQPAPDGNAEEEPSTAPSPAVPDGNAEDRIVAAADQLAPYEGLLLTGAGRTLRTVSFDDDLAALLGSVAAAPEPAALTRCDVAPADGALGVVATFDGESVVVEVTPAAGGAGVRVLGCDGEPLLREQYGAR